MYIYLEGDLDEKQKDLLGAYLHTNTGSDIFDSFADISKCSKNHHLEDLQVFFDLIINSSLR